MLKSLTIENFRAFDSLTLDGLNRINLIAGENNTGKTGVLEALHLLFCDPDKLSEFPGLFRQAQNSRDDFDSFWNWLVHNGRDKNPQFNIYSPKENGFNFNVEGVLLDNLDKKN